MSAVESTFGRGCAGLDDRLCGPTNGGLTVEGATGFGAVVCMPVINPWLGSGGAGLDDSLDGPFNRAGSIVDHTRFGPDA
jgi:hypothetical protein